VPATGYEDVALEAISELKLPPLDRARRRGTWKLDLSVLLAAATAINPKRLLLRRPPAAVYGVGSDTPTAIRRPQVIGSCLTRLGRVNNTAGS